LAAVNINTKFPGFGAAFPVTVQLAMSSPYSLTASSSGHALTSYDTVLDPTLLYTTQYC